MSAIKSTETWFWAQGLLWGVWISSLSCEKHECPFSFKKNLKSEWVIHVSDIGCRSVQGEGNLSPQISWDRLHLTCDEDKLSRMGWLVVVPQPSLVWRRKKMTQSAHLVMTVLHHLPWTRNKPNSSSWFCHFVGISYFFRPVSAQNQRCPQYSSLTLFSKEGGCSLTDEKKNPNNYQKK